MSNPDSTDGLPLLFHGTWAGSYRYNMARLDAQFGAVPFGMKLREDAGGEFHGSVEDDVEQGGTPGRGDVKGLRRGRFVKWTKSMPIRSILKRVRGELKSERDPGKPHRPLLYSGTIDDCGTKASGKWKFGGLLGFLMVRGTWTAERCAD